MKGGVRTTNHFYSVGVAEQRLSVAAGGNESEQALEPFFFDLHWFAWVDYCTGYGASILHEYGWYQAVPYLIVRFVRLFEVPVIKKLAFEVVERPACFGLGPNRVIAWIEVC